MLLASEEARPALLEDMVEHHRLELTSTLRRGGLEIPGWRERIEMRNCLTKKALLELLNDERPWVREVAITRVGTTRIRIELPEDGGVQPEGRSRRKP